MARKSTKTPLTKEQAKTLFALAGKISFPKEERVSIFQFRAFHDSVVRSTIPRLVQVYLIDLATDADPELIAPARFVHSRRRIAKEIKAWLERRPGVEDIAAILAPQGGIDPELAEAIGKDLETQLAPRKRRKRKGK